MLEVLVRIVCAIMMVWMGYYVIKKIINGNNFVFNIKNISLVLTLIFFSVLLYSIEYTMLYSLTIFLLNFCPLLI